MLFTERDTMPIFLALITPEDSKEYHIKWDGHDSVDSAQDEMNRIWEKMIPDNKSPLPYYIYEAESTKEGYTPYTVDEIDFNFYIEKTPEQIAASEKKFKDAMVLLKQKADEEQRVEDELKAKAKNA